jgi:hypothetical protein
MARAKTTVRQGPRGTMVKADGTLEITIPKMPMWEQVGGDMNPGAHGAILARSDGGSLEMLEIQPVRDNVGDDEARDVGFPFWTREASYDLDDLSTDRKEVQDALESIDMELDTLRDEFTPTQRAMVIAQALFGYGAGADEGQAGWSDDVVPDEVKWMEGKVAGPEYLADDDDEFIRDVLLGDLEIDYEQFGPDKKNPTSGLKVESSRGGKTIEITEWTDIEDANGEEQPDGEKISKQSAEVELDELFDLKGKHRGTYSGDDQGVRLLDLGKMDEDDREKAIVAAAISYLAYHGGEEEFVDAVGD